MSVSVECQPIVDFIHFIHLLAVITTAVGGNLPHPFLAMRFGFLQPPELEGHPYLQGEHNIDAQPALHYDTCLPGQT